MLITLLNDGTLITIGYDTVEPAARPQQWNLKAMFLVAGVLGGLLRTFIFCSLHYT